MGRKCFQDELQVMSYGLWVMSWSFELRTDECINNTISKLPHKFISLEGQAHHYR